MKKYYVLGLLFSENEEKVVLIRKNKPESMKGLLNGLGGKIELNEIPLDAMIREFKEEAGLEIKTWKEFCRLNNDNFEVYCFKTFGDVNQIKTMEEEQVAVYDIREILYEKTMTNLLWLIHLALDSDDIYGEINYF